MNYLSLFSGAGGFDLGLLQAGCKFNTHYFSEVDKYAINVFKKQFPEAIELGSVVDIRPETLKPIDIITFGFPCQDLSVAGKRSGLSGKRSGLFYEAMRIIEATRPTVFIFENVKGLFSSNRGRDFETVLQTIANIGLYECEWQLVNTRWVLPQNRERVYFIGHSRGRSRPKVFPFTESCFGVKKTTAGVRGEIPTEGQGGDSRHANKSVSQDGQNGHLHQIGTIGKDAEATRVYDTTHTIITKQGTPKNNQTYASCLSGGAHSGGNHSDMDLLKLNQAASIRRLTPTECERLQGFPDGWTSHGADGTPISDTQRYKLMGNAISIPIVKLIAERLIA